MSINLKKKEKIDKILKNLNSKAEIINSRTFTNKNSKDLIKFFNHFNTKTISKIINFYFSNYENLKSNRLISNKNDICCYKELYLPLKYKFQKDKFINFCNLGLNVPLTDTTNYLERSKMLNYTLEEEKFEEELIKQIYKFKLNSIFVFLKAFKGKIKFIGDDKFYSVKASYNYVDIQENTLSNLNEEAYLYLQGQNLEENLSLLEEIFVSLSADNIPQYKKEKKYEDITEDEKLNLNLINYEKELPEGWYTDGPVFVNPLGERKTYHPGK